jgi:hypothetical protein
MAASPDSAVQGQPGTGVLPHVAESWLDRLINTSRQVFMNGPDQGFASV